MARVECGFIIKATQVEIMLSFDGKGQIPPK